MPAFPLNGGVLDVAFVTSGEELVLVPGEDPGNLGSFEPAAVRFTINSSIMKINKPAPEIPAWLSEPVEVEPGVFEFQDVWIRELRQTWPAAILDAKGKPTNWDAPTSEISGPWAFLQVIVNDEDLTFYRDAPTIVESFGSSEPFGDDTCVILFPQVSPLESVRSFLVSELPVEVRAIKYDDTIETLFEGYIGAVNHVTTMESTGVRVECYGALYDGDRYLKHPPLHPKDPFDIGTLIWESLTQTPPLRVGAHKKVVTGIKSNNRGGWEPLITGYIADLLALASTDDGNQWTLMKKDGRIPELRLKDKTTVHWTVSTGAPGIETDLTKDFSTGHNAYYGEGVTEDNCRWRNAVYPNLNPDTAPVYPGVIYHPGNTYDENFRLFKNKIISMGYHVADDTTYHASEEPEIRRLQASYGGLVTGIVAAQTWAGTFEPGNNVGGLQGGVFFPLAYDPAVLVRLYRGNGIAKEENPDYDPAVIRRERYINFGSGVSLPDARVSSKDLFNRFYPADWLGDIKLHADPQEGHRFMIKAGQNILLKKHQGVDRLFHIARVEHDVQGGVTSIDVDEAGRDALTLAEVKQRNKDNEKASWRQDKKFRNSRQVEDKIAVWDCENGSGVIPRHGTFRKLWNVLSIPCAAGGTIVRSEFRLDTPARFAVGIFDQPVTHSYLRAIGGSPLDEGYWDNFGDGLIIAWGGEGQAAGYYPGSESNESPLTGVMIDDSQWYFESLRPPYLWVAIWVESPTINYMRGRLYPGSF